MARIYTEGFEGGDTGRWSTVNDGITVAAGGRGGAYLAHGSYFTNGFYYLYPGAQTEFYVRMAMYCDTNVTRKFFYWNTGGSFEYTPGAGIGTISAYVGAGAVAVAYVASTVAQWHVFEMHVKCAVAGSIQLKFDGTQVIDYSANLSAYAPDTFIFAPQPANPVGSTWYIDDLAINDTTGVVDNSWCGDGGVLAALVPTGVGTYSDLTASAGNAYQCVDDVPQNGDTDYIYSSTVGHKSTFAMSNLPALLAGASIARVWTEIVARETAAVGAKIATFIRSGATDIQGSDQTLTLAYGRFIEGEHIVDPNTAAPWSEAGVNAIEAGVRTR